jgi:hypothetical protein
MVKLLAGNYRGLAQMSNLISDWLLVSGMDETEVNTLIEDELKQLILQNFDPKKADTIFREGSVRIFLETSLTISARSP